MFAPDMALSSHNLMDGGKLGRKDECGKNEKASFPSTRFLLDEIIVGLCPGVKTTGLRPWEKHRNLILA